EADGVEPADAPRPPGGRAVLVAALADAVRQVVEELGGEEAGADARGVGLDDADDDLDGARADAGADAGAAGDGMRRGDERIGTVIEVEHRPLRALEDDPLPAGYRGLDDGGGVGDKGPQLLAVG